MASKDMNRYFETVVDRKEVFEKHRCFDRGWNGAGQTPVGRVVCCKDCGKHWYVKERWIEGDRVWKPVRWYHYRMRRAIVGK